MSAPFADRLPTNGTPRPDLESALVDKVRTGDARAFDDLVAGYGKGLRLFISPRVNCQADVADVAQEVWLRVWRKRENIKSGTNVFSWLLTIASHLIIDRSRSPARLWETQGSSDETSSGPKAEGPSTARDAIPNGCDAREQLQRCLDCILRTMSLDEQMPILLSDFYGFTDKESARILKMPVGAFKHRIQHARSEARRSRGHECAVIEKTGMTEQCRHHFRAQSPSVVKVLTQGQDHASKPMSLPSTSAQAEQASLRSELLRGLISREHLGTPLSVFRAYRGRTVASH